MSDGNGVPPVSMGELLAAYKAYNRAKGLERVRLGMQLQARMRLSRPQASELPILEDDPLPRFPVGQDLKPLIIKLHLPEPPRAPSPDLDVKKNDIEPLFLIKLPLLNKPPRLVDLEGGSADTNATLAQIRALLENSNEPKK